MKVEIALGDRDGQNATMPVDALIEALGYQESPNFLSIKEFRDVAGYSHLLQRATQKCQLKGVYVLKDTGSENQPSIVPLVYVCQGDGATLPHEIHRLAWNQNVVPFILVASRDVVRLYSGFNYGAATQGTDPDAGREGVLKGAVALKQVAEQLSSLRAADIDRGEVWRTWERKIDPRGRVDWRLLDNLSKLGAWLRSQGLQRNTAHALIGKYVYLRYLHDRGILSPLKFEEWGLDPGTVFGRRATIIGLRSVIRRLEDWLNGSVFPIKLTGTGSPSPKHIERVAGAFMGDDPITGQLHLDFQPYDFSHVPIETLSVIYEQFLHAEGRGKDAGAYYTPVPIVNFMLQELEDRLPLRPGMKVLDASCGSGAFLVQCYRRLIERRVRETGCDLKPSELRQLLTESIFGVDRDKDACRVAELSLVLTLIDYIDPPDLRRNPSFKIPMLHNNNIFRSDFFSPKCPIRAGNETDRFDWVVGNPPWVEVKQPPDDEAGEEKEDLDRYVRRWIVRRAKSHPTGGNQAAHAFVWQLGELLKEDGCAALLLPAKILFSYEAQRFRQELFKRFHVWGVANFSNLTEVLFAGRSRVPAAAFYFSPSADDTLQDTYIYSPFVANQEANRPVDPNTRKDTWNIVINAGEIRRVGAADSARGDLLTWKVAMWGSPRDERLIRSVRKRFPALSTLRDMGVEIQEGIQLRPEGTKGTELVEELIDKKVLQMEALRGKGRIFVFPKEAMGTIDRKNAYLRTRGGKKGLLVSYPPHVIVDASRRFAVYTDEFLVVPPRQIGIAGKRHHESLLKALSLFLVSDFATYYQFFTSPDWGVKRELATIRSLKEIPIPFEGIGEADLAPWVELHSHVIREWKVQRTLFDDVDEAPGMSPSEIDSKLNQLTYSALSLTAQEICLVADLARVRIELDEGKLGAAAVDPPREPELLSYALALAGELDSFLGDPNRMHAVRILHDGISGIVETRITPRSVDRIPLSVETADRLTAESLSKLRELARHEISQWVYFDRRLIILEGERTMLLKPLQRFHWTPAQALNDADTIIGETISGSDQVNVDRV
jgi:SAM-dependent methyltransferase